MAQLLNITDKLDNDKPIIQIGEKKYPVNNDLRIVFKFNELQSLGTQDSIIQGLTLALGEEAMKEIDVESFSMKSLQVLMIALTGAMQDMTYEEAEKRFRKSTEQ